MVGGIGIILFEKVLTKVSGHGVRTLVSYTDRTRPNVKHREHQQQLAVHHVYTRRLSTKGHDGKVNMDGLNKAQHMHKAWARNYRGVLQQTQRLIFTPISRWAARGHNVYPILLFDSTLLRILAALGSPILSPSFTLSTFNSCMYCYSSPRALCRTTDRA